MIKAVIFDMDGVLVDSEIVYVKHIMQLYHQHGKMVTFDQVKRIVGTSTPDSLEFLMDLWQEEISAKDFNDLYQAHGSKLVVDYPSIMKDHVETVLKQLKSDGYLVGLASSSPLWNIKDVIQTCHIESYFDVVLSGESFEKSKPHPEIYLTAASKLGVQPSECLVIEDSHPGIEAGKKANMTVLALHDPHFDIDQSNADKRIQSLDEILKYLNELK